MSHAISYDECIRHEGMCPDTEIIRFNSVVPVIFLLAHFSETQKTIAIRLCSIYFSTLYYCLHGAKRLTSEPVKYVAACKGKRRLTLTSSGDLNSTTQALHSNTRINIGDMLGVRENPDLVNSFLSVIRECLFIILAARLFVLHMKPEDALCCFSKKAA